MNARMAKSNHSFYAMLFVMVVWGWLLPGCASVSSEAPLYIRSENKLANAWTEDIRDTMRAVEGLLPQNGSIVPLLRPAQKSYVCLPAADRLPKFADASFRKTVLAADGEHPAYIRFSWNRTKEESIFHLIISESADMKPAVEFPVTGNSIDLFNFKIGTTYYWTVMGENRAIAEIHSFVTEDIAPRLVQIDNIPNVRDLGGRMTRDGVRVRQNMIFRSAQLNGGSTFKRMPKEEAIEKYPRQIVEPGNGQGKAENNDCMPFCFSRTWTVFKPNHHIEPDKLLDFHSLTAIPQEYEGVAGVNFKVDEDSKISFSPWTDMPAFFIQEFEAPADGMVCVGAGGDWFWSLAVNGTFVCNMKNGNMMNPVSTSNYILNIPVKKGRNIITVVLRSGMKGWEWCFGPPPEDRSSVTVAIPGKSFLNDDMLEYVAVCLKMKTEIDLRNRGESEGLVDSPLGPQAKIVHISSGSYEDMATSEFRDAFAMAFRILLDEKNYPVLFHCVAGQDRTGALAYILNGLLGVDENNLDLDWECTGFWNTGNYFRHDTRLNRLKAVFQSYPGKAIQDKIEAYAIDCGISKEEIRLFRKIMIE